MSHWVRHSVGEPFGFKLVSKRVVAGMLALLALNKNEKYYLRRASVSAVHVLPIPARTSISSPRCQTM
ncbi:hypothetical protein PITC_063840 [Penicillium italicum]|uniref:Uncharacterized protein n=1 Tax=Penicillium italicum TaxID=40296 RepID=A0A0A2KL55_PENIT|nr:hypothetical protein PITC_063840 [Penicillium italicum]